MAKVKTLWRGVFCYNHFVEKPIYRQAFTKKQAWKIMCDYLAVKHEVHPRYVYAMFDGNRDNFSIEPETVWKELDDAKMQELR